LAEEGKKPQKERRGIGRRLRILLLVFIVAAVCISAFKYYWMSFPVGSGPAGPAVPKEAFESAWSRRNVLLLGVGDSITDGFGASQGKSFFDRLVRNPDDEFPDMKGICLANVLPNLTARNLAVSGSTSLELVETLREKLKVQDRDTLGLVIMTTGGNDIIHDYGKSDPKEGAMYGATLEQAEPWIESYEKRLDTIMEFVESRFPGGCHIFIADIYDFTDGVGDIWRVGLPAWPDGIAIHAAYNEAIRRCAAGRESVHMVPMYDEFLGHGFRCRQFWRDTYDSSDPHYWYGSNLEDPNDRGYDAIRRLYLIEIAKVLKE
jgi:lysophospholipase L1-like esterase